MLEDAFTQADYAINLTDPDGRLLRVNQAYLRLYKFTSEEEVLGKTQSIIRSPLTPNGLYKEMWRTIKSGAPWRGELTNKAIDGSDVHIHLTISPVRRDGAVVGYMGFSLDRAQQVHLEQQLLHANKLVVLGTLGAGLAHEMNNPLASILLDAEYLKDLHAHPSPNPDHASALAAAESVIRGVERMRRVLQHLLLYSKKDAAEARSSVALKELIDDAFLFTERQLTARDIALRVEVSDFMLVVGNRTQLESVIHNLLSNSRDAFESSGDGDKYISIQARRTPLGSAEIVYEDNAGGIPPALMQKIFEPFFTTKPEGKGTGLGLSLSRKIVNDHGGTLHCESEHGRTRFTILLPTSD